MSEKKNNKNKWIELAVILIGLTLGILHACFDVKIPFLPKSGAEKAAEEMQKNAEEMQKNAEEMQKNLEKGTENLKKVNMRLNDQTEP